MANKRNHQSFGKRQSSTIKRKRKEVKESADLAPQKAIFDVNYDCLERVFEFLDFRDLINVADANAHLKVAAKRVLVRKLERRLIILEVSIYNNAIFIRKMLLAAKIIRLFGQCISGIQIKIIIDSFREKFFFPSMNIATKRYIFCILPDSIQTIFTQRNIRLKMLKNCRFTSIDFFPVCVNGVISFQSNKFLDSNIFPKHFRIWTASLWIIVLVGHEMLVLMI